MLWEVGNVFVQFEISFLSLLFFFFEGMAAQIPIKDDPKANAAAMQKVKEDKEREASLGQFFLNVSKKVFHQLCYLEMKAMMELGLLIQV